MRYARVLVNRPARSLDNYFTYHIPQRLNDEIEFGKRVLVELGRKKVEGFIIDEDAPAPDMDTKPILSVLDREAVLNPDLYELARWLAETCMCPLSLAINAMIPRKLSKKSGRVVVAQMDGESWSQYLAGDNGNNHAVLLETLFERGDMDYREALKYASADELAVLHEKGLLHISGAYIDYRKSRDEHTYVLGDAFNEKQLEILKRRAPRQAQAMQLLLEQQSVSSRQLAEIAPASSIKSLLSRGYIKRERLCPVKEVRAPRLNQEQRQVLAAIDHALALAPEQEILLYGVTGSGKTEVYIRAALSCIERGRKVIMLIPEIALTRHLLELFTDRIPEMAVLHSKMSPGERYEEWKRIKNGQVNLVMGTRSAIFAPLDNIGLIIMDEEQEYTYKQEQQPRYHSRDVARERVRRSGALLLLGSATPAVETYYRSECGESTRLDISGRAGDATLPRIYIEDMRKAARKAGSPIVSPLLEEKIKNTLERKEQSILFLNRRGFSPYTICRSCGHTLACPNCSVGLNYHKDQNTYLCHYCGINIDKPEACPACGSSYMQQTGYGTQKVEEDVRLLFPGARIARLDLDSSSNKGVQDRILQAMKKNEIDILIGTQMVAKGLDFAGVSLVGVLDADGMLNLPDFRSGERCFQLIVQAAGRAGRGAVGGEVVIQTYNPDNQLIAVAARQDYNQFYREEIKWRQLLNYPPFSHILRIVSVSAEESLARRLADMIMLYINEITDAQEDNIMVLGPAPCPLYRIRNRIRYQLIVKSENMLLLNSIGTNIASKEWHKQVRLEIDLNPLISM
ncbi:replication restart helicase PriA [Syntrophomonas curvata]